MTKVRFGRYVIRPEIEVLDGVVYNLYEVSVDHVSDLDDKQIPVEEMIWLKDHYGFVQYCDIHHNNVKKMLDDLNKIGLKPRPTKRGK